MARHLRWTWWLLVAPVLACAPFPGQPCARTRECPTGSACHGQLQVCTRVEVEILDVLPVYPAPWPGWRELPILLHVQNHLDREVELTHLEPVFSDQAEHLSWHTGQTWPLRIAAGAVARVILIHDVDAATAPGLITVDAWGLARDIEREQVLETGLARATASLDVQPLLPVDPDGDGLTIEQETALGLDPQNPDSDGDGIDDAIEAPGAQARDSDGDGTIDALDDDSDNGGMPDLLEWTQGRDPLSAADDVPYSLDLVVDVEADTLDGGADNSEPSTAMPGLSLREALTIATNRPGPDRIRFAPGVTRIVLSSAIQGGEALLPMLSDDDTFIDGNGVELSWDTVERAGQWTQVIRADGLRGFALRNVGIRVTSTTQGPWSSGSAVALIQAISATVAHVEIETSSAGRLQLWGVETVQSRAALLYDVTWDAQGDGYPDVFVVKESVGCHLRRCRARGAGTGVKLEDSLDTLIEDCEFFDTDKGIEVGATGTVIRHNTIHDTATADIALYRLPVAIEDNVLSDSEGVGIGVALETDGGVLSLRRNRLTGHRGAGLFLGETNLPDLLQAPVIDRVGLNVVTGRHPIDGVEVDLFADPDDEAGQYLGSATVQQGTWQVVVQLPLPRDSWLRAIGTDTAGSSSGFSTSIRIP